MSTVPSVAWYGQSGRRYDYTVHDFDIQFTHAPGNYIFAGVVGGYWRAMYIGESSDLGHRLTEWHEKRADAIGRGATHIHAHRNYDGPQERRAEERDLILAHHPPCND